MMKSYSNSRYWWPESVIKLALKRQRDQNLKDKEKEIMEADKPEEGNEIRDYNLTGPKQTDIYKIAIALGWVLNHTTMKFAPFRVNYVEEKACLTFEEFEVWLRSLAGTECMKLRVEAYRAHRELLAEIKINTLPKSS